MSSSSYKYFAVIGGGTIGLPILSALVAKNASVVLLSRAESTVTKTVPTGVQIEKVDLADPAAVAEVFKRHSIDVVVAAIPRKAITSQKPLVDAAKLAGVKLFIPSEYGMATDGLGSAEGAEKARIAEYAKEVGVPTTRIFAGLLTQYIPLLVGYPDKIYIVGKGESPVSCTAIGDIAGYVAHILTTQPPSVLENQILRLEGQRTTLKALAPLFKTTAEHVDALPASKPMAAFATLLQQPLELGFGSSGWDSAKKVERTGSDAAGSGNALWPGHQWQSIKDVHNL